jgi:hypothetical protein
VASRACVTGLRSLNHSRSSIVAPLFLLIPLSPEETSDLYRVVCFSNPQAVTLRAWTSRGGSGPLEDQPCNTIAKVQEPTGQLSSKNNKLAI